MTLAADAAGTRRNRAVPRVLPGFGLSLGFTILALSLLVLLPLAALVLRGVQIGPAEFAAILADRRVLSALRLSFGLALAAAAVATFLGLVIAWVLVRYEFPGRRLADALIDLPFALPTAVAGIALASLYAPQGAIGRPLAALGITAAYTPLGIFIAMLFIAIPFTVRTVQPVIGEIDSNIEEASATLGASRARTLVRGVLPPLLPSLLSGFALAFARCVGEYGSIIFIAGNMPNVSEIAPLLIVVKLSEFDYAGACAIATIMLAVSFLALLAINLLATSARRRFGFG